MTREMTKVTTSSPTSVGTNQTSRCSASARSLMAPRARAVRDALLRVAQPADLLAVADGAEANALDVLGPWPVVLGVVDPDAGGVLHHDARGVLVGLLAHLAIGGLERRVEQLVDLRILVEARRLERAPLAGVKHLADPVVRVRVV